MEAEKTDPPASDVEEHSMIVPKPAFVTSPPEVSMHSYRKFKSSQPLSGGGQSKKRKPVLYGELPQRGNAPPHATHYHHKYYSPPSPPTKRVSHIVNTPRFVERSPSPRPAPAQYYPVLPSTGPSYSFGAKLGEKAGGHTCGRTSWEKAWFATNDVWKVKTNFEEKWPEIGCHDFSCLGKRLPYLTNGPSPSFGVKLRDLNAQKRAQDPSPNSYDVTGSLKHFHKSSPSYTMVRKDYHSNTWVSNRTVPGPGSYMPNTPAVKPKVPAYSFARPSPAYTQFCC